MEGFVVPVDLIGFPGRRTPCLPSRIPGIDVAYRRLSTLRRWQFRRQTCRRDPGEIAGLQEAAEIRFCF